MAPRRLRVFIEQLLGRLARLQRQRRILFQVRVAQQWHAALALAEKLARAALQQVLA